MQACLGWRATRLALLLAGLLGAGDAAAVELGSDVELHAFGSQDYAQTTDNAYLGASRKGTWDDNFLGLVTAVTITQKSKLWAQLETSNSDGTRFTWAFVDYEFSDNIQLHVGRVRFPLGLYNEIIDTKLLQLSSIEPSIYQTAADFVHDSYTGAGFDYRKSVLGGSILVQVYGGQPYDPDNSRSLHDRNMYGSRLTYDTPLSGLRFMASFFRGHVEIVSTAASVPEQRIILSADYQSNDWDAKAEFATHHFLGVSSNGYYLQLGRTFLDKWVPFARYEVVNLDRARQNASFSQKATVFGLGYKIISNVAVRAEAHLNRGYALPVASGEIQPGAGVPNWTLFVVGIHFTF